MGAGETGLEDDPALDPILLQGRIGNDGLRNCCNGYHKDAETEQDSEEYGVCLHFSRLPISVYCG